MLTCSLCTYEAQTSATVSMPDLQTLTTSENMKLDCSTGYYWLPVTSAHQVGPKSRNIGPRPSKGRCFLWRPRHRASVSCARNNCCSSEEASRLTDNKWLVLSQLRHRILRPSNLTEDQQNRAASSDTHPEWGLWLCCIHAVVEQFWSCSKFLEVLRPLRCTNIIFNC